MTSLFGIFKVFRLPPSAIFALALGIPLFFFSLIFVLDLLKISPRELPNEVIGWLVMPAILVASIAWVASIMNVIIWLGRWLRDSFLEHQVQSREKKRALMYFTDKDALTVLQLGLVLYQKQKGTKIFQAASFGPPDDLHEMGILTRVKFINAIYTEYEIPDFIWNHVDLLVHANKDDYIKLYLAWEKKRLQGDRI